MLFYNFTVVKLSTLVKQEKLKSSSENEISDVIINLASEMMSRQYEWIQGLEDPIFVQKLSFQIIQSKTFV